MLHNVSTSIVNHDVFTFLEHNLRLIGRERSLDAGWPGEEAIRRLVENATGLFVWAATACRFIREGKRFVAKRLATILEHCSTAIIEPEKHLINSIYITVLEPSISSDYNDVFGLCQRVNCGHPANLSGLAPKQGPLTLAGCPQLLAGSLGGPRANVSGVLAGRQIGKRRKHLSFHVC